MVAIATGHYHSLLLKADGTVADCGVFWEGLSPIVVPAGLSDIVAVSAGESHSLALKADGTVAVWGFNTCGQTNVPPGLTNVVAISAGANRRLKDKADVNELILRRKLPRDLAVNPAVSTLYLETWDALQAEK